VVRAGQQDPISLSDRSSPGRMSPATAPPSASWSRRQSLMSKGCRREITAHPPGYDYYRRCVRNASGARGAYVGPNTTATPNSPIMLTHLHCAIWCSSIKPILKRAQDPASRPPRRYSRRAIHRVATPFCSAPAAAPERLVRQARTRRGGRGFDALPPRGRPGLESQAIECTTASLGRRVTGPDGRSRPM